MEEVPGSCGGNAKLFFIKNCFLMPNKNQQSETLTVSLQISNWQLLEKSGRRGQVGGSWGCKNQTSWYWIPVHVALICSCCTRVSAFTSSLCSPSSSSSPLQGRLLLTASLLQTSFTLFSAAFFFALLYTAYVLLHLSAFVSIPVLPLLLLLLLAACNVEWMFCFRPNATRPRFSLGR